MLLSYSPNRLVSARADHHLHREKLGKHQMLPRRIALRRRGRKMDLVQSVLARAELHALRQQCRHRVRIEILERVEDQSAKDAL